MPVPRLVPKQSTYDSPIIEILQRDLANAWVLYANYKHYHWQTYGPLFRDLHLLFDDFADQVFDTIDDFAERIRRLGPDVANITLAQFQQAASVQSSTANQSMMDMLEEAHANLLLVIQGMRDASRVADDNNDPGSVDLYSKIVQIHEKARVVLAANDAGQNRINAVTANKKNKYAGGYVAPRRRSKKNNWPGYQSLPAIREAARARPCHAAGWLVHGLRAHAAGSSMRRVDPRSATRRGAGKQFEVRPKCARRQFFSVRRLRSGGTSNSTC